jgi:hypothetical protein
MDWFLAMLQAVMTDVMASEGTPLKKANAIARLGNLYLKACRTKELQAANRELARRVAALEERLAAAESRLTAPPTSAGAPRERPAEARPLQVSAVEGHRAVFPLGPEEPPARGVASRGSSRPERVTASARGRASP